MMGDLFSKLQEARGKIEEAKKKLNEIVIEAESEGGNIRISANANKMITRIEIDEAYSHSVSGEELGSALLATVNKALEEAARKGEIEMKKLTRDVLPNFPGLV